MMAKLDNDPNLIRLCDDVWKAERAKAKLQSDNDIDVETTEKLNDIIKIGAISKQKIITFIDTLITTWNPLSAEERANFAMGKGVNHACSKRVDNILDDEKESDKDYIDLINSVERHRKHSTYCIRYKHGKMECRFHFPFKERLFTDFKFTKRKDGGWSVEILTKRNDPLLNKHGRLQIQNFRSNVDMQIVLNWRACLEYIAKYSAKAEKRAENINEILAKIVRKLSNSDSIHKAFRSMMIATIAIKEYSHQEAMQLLLNHEYPLVECKQFDFLDIDLRQNRRITKNKKVIPSILDIYGHRCKYGFNDSKDINLHDFIIGYRYDQRQKKIKLRHCANNVDIVVNYIPKYCNKRHSKTFFKHIRQQLIKYKPWKDSVENAWIGYDGNDNEQIFQCYQSFIQSPWAQNNLSQYVLNEINLHNVELEEDELLNVQPQIDPICTQQPWQILCSLIDNDPDLNINNGYNWQTDAIRYVDIMPLVEDHIAQLNAEPPTNVDEEINFNESTLTAGQRIAYNIIIQHYEL